MNIPERRKPRLKKKDQRKKGKKNQIIDWAIWFIAFVVMSLFLAGMFYMVDHSDPGSSTFSFPFVVDLVLAASVIGGYIWYQKQ